MIQKRYKKGGFTLIEILVVVAIIATIASFASNSINTAIRMHRQMQAAYMISNTIRSIRSFALSQNLDENKPIYYETASGLSTRNAFSLYFFRGRINPEDGAVVGLADGGDESDLAFSILPVRDPGYSIADRVMGPDNPVMSGGSVENSVLKLEEINQELNAYLISLPVNTVLLFSAVDDGIRKGGDPSADLLGDLEYVSYGVDGTLNLRLKDVVRTYNLFTSPGFDQKKAYIAVMMVYAGSSVDESMEPVYVDLRTGDMVRDLENMANINFPQFSD